jgi:chromosome segregation ATPase
MSFSELAWLALLLGMLDHAAELDGVRQEIAARDARIAELSRALTVLENRHHKVARFYASLVTELNQSKLELARTQRLLKTSDEARRRAETQLADVKRVLRRATEELTPWFLSFVDAWTDLDSARVRIAELEKTLADAQELILKAL